MSEQAANDRDDSKSWNSTDLAGGVLACCTGAFRGLTLPTKFVLGSAAVALVVKSLAERFSVEQVFLRVS